MSEDWCIDFFDDTFADLYLERGPEATRPAVAFLRDKLRLSPGASFYDQCCGVGTLSLALAAEGFRATGADLVPSYVSRAAASARKAKLDCSFHKADARSFTTPDPVDAAFNWWTSFGYFQDDAENIRMLTAAQKSLKPGGFFALDYMNREERLAAFTEEDTLVSLTPTGAWQTSLDRERGLLLKSWVYRDAEGKLVERNGGGVKLYGASDLAWLLEEAGFGGIRFYGDYAGAELTPSSPRCIAVAQKPGGRT